MIDWQPMKTAPKDGRLILVFELEHEKEYPAYSNPNLPNPAPYIAYWDAGTDHYEKGAWLEYYTSDEVRPKRWAELTYPKRILSDIEKRKKKAL